MVFKMKMTGANCVLLCAALFSSSLTAYATEKSADSMADSSASGVVQGKIAVSGTVKDKNGEPLIGVSVVEKGTTNGMITDLDGNFSLSVSSPDCRTRSVWQGRIGYRRDYGKPRTGSSQPRQPGPKDGRSCRPGRKAEETITFVTTDDLTPGIYFMVVKGADYTETVKVIVK